MSSSVRLTAFDLAPIIVSFKYFLDTAKVGQQTSNVDQKNGRSWMSLKPGKHHVSSKHVIDLMFLLFC